MIRIFFLCLVFLIFSKTLFSQSGGYLGKHHLIGLQVNLHPIFYDADSYIIEDIKSKSSSKVARIFTPSLNYEFVIGKSFSLSASLGFKHFSVGEEDEELLLITPDAESNLFDSEDISSVNENYYSKFYISGFDLNMVGKFYFYKSSGKIAPLGKYFSLNFGLPFYKTYYREDIVEYSNQSSYGIGLGSQGILFSNLTYDYGCRFSLSDSFDSQFENNDLINTSNLTDLENSVPSTVYWATTNIFQIYFKVSYLF